LEAKEITEMPKTSQPSDAFCIVLSTIRHGAQIGVASAELGKVMRVDARIAGSIIKRAPIILFKDATKEEVDMARAHLVVLARVGLDFKITQTPSVNIPKVNWPHKPDLLAMFKDPPSESIADVLPTAMDVSVQVLCPCCGSSLQLHILPLGAPFEPDKLTVEEIHKAQPLTEAAEGAPMEVAPTQPSFSPVQREIEAPVSFEPAQATAAAVAEPQEAVAVLALSQGEYMEPWKGQVYDAVPLTAGGDDAIFLSAPGMAVAEAPVGADPLERVEPVEIMALDGPVEMEEKVEPVEAEELEPWSGSARAYEAKEEEPAKEGPAKEELEPWSGSARAYEPTTSSEQLNDEVTVAADDLEPWSGRARDYEAKTASPETGVSDDLGGDKLLADVPEKGVSNDLSEGLDDVPEIGPVETVEPVEVFDAMEVEEVEEVEEKPKKAKKAKKLKKKKKKRKKDDAVEESPTEPVAEKPPSDDGAFSVFLSKISSSKKKKKAVDLLCEIRGISESEAQALAKKMIIPVAKGVTKEKAEEILTLFRENKIPGRITKKK
jgi:hypothetical protein